MPSMTNNRSYSDFFTSGFRAMANRQKRKYSTVSNTPVMSIDSTTTASSSRRHSSLRNFTNRPSRPTSMIVSPSSSSSVKTDMSSRDRRSSLVTFSTWLFDRKAPHSDDYLSFSNSPPKNKRELLSTTEITEVWITAGGPFIPTEICKNETYYEKDDFLTIDPFSASPDSKSFFIESPPPSTGAKRESFLSLTASSPDRSFLHLPSLRRERPTSIHTMPLPSRSRRSSFQSYLYRTPGRNKSHHSWTVEEESRASTPEPLTEDTHDWADPAHMDWRQFHIELLRDEA